MKRLTFVWENGASLTNKSNTRPRKIALKLGLHGRPISLTIWEDDSTGLRIFPVMYDLGERFEIGVLKFQLVHDFIAEERFLEPPTLFQYEVEILKLTIKVNNVVAESGVEFRSAGGKLVIVAGAYPYTIAIEGIGQIPHVFEPEYSIDEYEREPIT
jgi:hypothetical protein